MLDWIRREGEFFYQLSREVVTHTFYRDNAALLAAAISFYAILSFIPLVLVLLSISGYLLHSSDELALQFFTLIDDTFPTATAQAMEVLSGVIGKRHLFGLAGLVALTWSASRIFNVAESAMNIVWKPERLRPYWKSRLLNFGFVPFSLVIIIFSFSWTALNSLAKETTLPLMGIKLTDTFLFRGVAPILFPILLSFSLLFFIYKTLPSHKPSWTACVVGAGFASLVWEISKLLFDLYIKNFGEMNKIYGSLGGIVILILWIYYSAYILIVGAEVGAAWEKLSKKNT